MTMSQAFLAEVADEAIAIALATYNTIRESLPDAPVSAAGPWGDPSDFGFARWFAERTIADPNWLLALALDDEDNGRKILQRYRKITGVDPLLPIMDLLPPEQAEFVMAKATGATDAMTLQEYISARHGESSTSVGR